MRRSILATGDSLVERIISPTVTVENEYINWSAARRNSRGGGQQSEHSTHSADRPSRSPYLSQQSVGQGGAGGARSGVGEEVPGRTTYRRGGRRAMNPGPSLPPIVAREATAEVADDRIPEVIARRESEKEPQPARPPARQSSLPLPEPPPAAAVTTEPDNDDASADNRRQRLATIEMLKLRLQQMQIVGPGDSDGAEDNTEASEEPTASSEQVPNNGNLDDQRDATEPSDSKESPSSRSRSDQEEKTANEGRKSTSQSRERRKQDKGKDVPAERAPAKARPPRTRPHRSKDAAANAPDPPTALAENLFVKTKLPTLAPSDSADMDPTRRRSRQELSPGKPMSALTALFMAQSRSDNPFGLDFSFFSGKGDPQPIKLCIYLPMSDEPEVPLTLSVLREASVEEAMGYALYEYWAEGRQPIIPEELRDVKMWNMRIVEDDGTIDDDFPALERTRKISKFAFDQFALVAASPDQIKRHDSNLRKAATSSTADLVSPTSSNAAPAATTVFLKVHLYSTIEVKQTTTMPVASNIPLAEVFEQICRKRKYDPSKYVFKMADTQTDVPLDKTLDQLRVSELCILKRAGGGAGDVFLRPPDEKVDVEDQPRFIEPDEYTSMYKQYNVVHKAFMGRAYDRILTIDGDYIHIMTGGNKQMFDTMKTASHHINSVMSCKATKKSNSFKLIVQGKSNDPRSYDLEASSENEAAEICSKISFLTQLNKRDSKSIR
ncbi:hypothetical protein HDU90_002218 [Geranomyces variabilis]|nr:hypothetical protein HDU90_002218 [Geranomyces variabilis]